MERKDLYNLKEAWAVVSKHRKDATKGQTLFKYKLRIVPNASRPTCLDLYALNSLDEETQTDMLAIVSRGHLGDLSSPSL